MTTVTFTKTNKTIRVTAHDHAYGSDIVCNGISVLMYSLESWLLNHSDCIKCHESEFNAGSAEIEFVPVKPKVYDILEFVYEGLMQVQNTYGKKFISVNASPQMQTLMG